jgi:maltose/moltooligosaccharide transporter
MQESNAANLLSVMFLSFLVFAVPAGFLSERFGRKRMVIVGLTVMVLTSILVLFSQDITLIPISLVFFGMSWTFIQVNVPVMIVDTPPDDNSMGTYKLISNISLGVNHEL